MRSAASDVVDRWTTDALVKSVVLHAQQYFWWLPSERISAGGPLRKHHEHDAITFHHHHPDAMSAMTATGAISGSSQI